MIRRFVLVAAVLGALGALLANWAGAQALRLGDPAPEIGQGSWINGEPLTMAGLRGQVVLVEFWTYG